MEEKKFNIQFHISRTFHISRLELTHSVCVQGDPFVNCVLNPCSQSPCGINADCSATGARAVCKCRPNYEGDPFVQCNLNPCQQSPCGVNAECSATGQRAVCKCRANYIGDPFSACRLEPCSTNPCGINADCTASGR